MLRPRALVLFAFLGLSSACGRAGDLPPEDGGQPDGGPGPTDGGEEPDAGEPVFPTPPPPQVLTLAPIADTTLDNWSQTTPLGANATMRVYSGLRKAVLSFDLSALPTSTLLGARLELSFKSVGNEWGLAKQPFHLYDVAVDFVESEATWLESASGVAWGSPGMRRYSDYEALPYQSPMLIVSAAGQVTLDVYDLIDRSRRAGKSRVNLTLFSSGPGNPTAEIHSREAADEGLRPVLELDHSPTAPEARPGDDRLVTTEQWGGNPIPLDGSASSLPDGTKAGLYYQWRIETAAPGSAYAKGQLVGVGPTPSFDPDVPGLYRITLRVTHVATGEFHERTFTLQVGLEGHPRLHIDASLLDDIKALRAASDPRWTRFFGTWSSGTPNSDIVNGTDTSYLLLYLVTGEATYAQRAIGRIKGNLYLNGTDSSGGLKWLKDNYSDNHSRAYQGGTLMVRVAMVYDWAYPELTPEQRQDIITWLNDAARYNHLTNGDARSYLRNDGAAVTYGVNAAAFATWGENPEGATLLRWANERWRLTLQGLDIIGKGGAMGEGNAYGTSPTGAALIRLADLVFHATGENRFLSHPWFRQRLSYDAFATYPRVTGGASSLYGWPSTPFPVQSSIGGDGQRGPRWHAINLRPNGLMLARRFSGTPEAAAWNWVYRQPEVDRMVSASDSFVDVLYDAAPKPALVKPTQLSHFDPSMGYVYLRSDWGSTDATWIAFWAGPHIDTHQHLDQGAFSLFKRRDLAPKTGNYDLDVTSPHSLAYYTRTVSSNGLLIGDPNEVFRGFIAGMGCDANGAGTLLTPPDYDPADPSASPRVCIPNEGGQRTMHPFGMGANNAEEFNHYREVFDVARVVHFDDAGGVVRVVADLTGAYNSARYATPGNSAKVAKVYRSLVYLREPDVLLVGDTVESTDAAFPKKSLLHSVDLCQVGGTVQAIRPGESVHTDTQEARIVVDDSDVSDRDMKSCDMFTGPAALLVKTVFPAQFQYRRVGERTQAATEHAPVYGASYGHVGHFHRHLLDFFVRDFGEGVLPNRRSHNWLVQNTLENNASYYAPTFRGGYGRCRIEVEPTQPATTDYFLQVLKPTVTVSETLPGVTREETSTEFGAQFAVGGKTYRVMFGKATLEPPEVTVGP